MTGEKSYARLGLFIVVTLVVVLATAIFFTQRLKKQAAIEMVTYTTENVFGLDVSSPVRLIGMPVGRVTGIRVDPLQKMVEIDFEVFIDRLNTVGMDVRRIRRITDVGGVFPKTRASIVGNPLTGEAYLLLDQPPNPPPPIQLGFKPNRPYIPSMPSMFESVQDRLPALLDRANSALQSLSQVVARMPDKDRMPALLDRVTGALETLDKVIARMPDSLDRSDRFLADFERTMADSQLPALSADSRKFFTTMSAQMDQIKSEMDGVIGAEGTLVKLSEEARAALKAADLSSTTQSAREAADNSRLASDDLRRSLPAIQNSLEQLRELSRMLAEQPESVVWGPRPPERKHR